MSTDQVPATVIENSESDIALVEEFATSFALSMDKVPSDGGWTASQCLAHLADAEISLALRVRMMLTSSDYKFANWDEDAFAALRTRRDPKGSLEVFRSLRRSTLELLSDLSLEQFNLTGIRANGESIRLIEYVAMMSRHVRNHLEQAMRAAQS